MHLIGQAIEAGAVVLLAVLARAVLVYFKPYRQCRWCRPGGLIGGSAAGRLAGRKPKRPGRRSCWRCKGSRFTRRLGAKQVHKTRLAAVEAWAERGSD
jgi:hypothetical protein